MVLLAFHAAGEENLEVVDVFLGGRERERGHHQKGKWKETTRDLGG